MAWNRDVCSFRYTPYFKPEMESVCIQREIYIVSYLADGSCHWSPDYDGRFHVWRGDSFQARIIISANQRWAGFCQRDSHGFGLLWICIDVTPSWTTLEHDDGDGKTVCKRTSNCWKMDDSWDCRLYSWVWRVCFHTAGNRTLYVLTKSICVFRF